MSRSHRTQTSPSIPHTASYRRGGANNAFAAVRPAVLLLAKALFVPLASAAPTLSTSIWQRGLSAFEEDAPKDADDPNLWVYLGVGVILVLLGGAFAGLTIALMGQDETYLQVIATSGEGSERRHADRVLRLLRRGKHWVLVTLLLSNVITNETLPIVLDRSLGGGWPAVLSSTVLIVIFGEIVPQSICVRYGLSIGAFMAPIVLALMWIMSPVAWPTAKLLDWLLGADHGTMYKKAGLKTLVQLHQSLGTTAGERLMDDEVTIINSVLDLKDKPVGNIMTPMQDVFTMSADTVLDEPMMDTILTQGYSRIPIYAPGNKKDFIGMLLVKILITYDPEDGMRVRDFSLATLPETLPRTSCLDIINFFQEGKSHMVMVSDFPGEDKGALGVVTLEDVIEELIGEEIIDESDVFIDVHKAIRRIAPAPKQRFKHKGQEPTVTSDPANEDKEADENEPLLGKDTAPRSRQASLTNGNIAPSSFFTRRKSSTASDTAKDVPNNTGSVPVRSSPAEMREHLKHLGPSNSAARPKPTKYASILIKPGLGTIPQGQPTSTGTNGKSNGNASSGLGRTELKRSASADVAPSSKPADKDTEPEIPKSAGRDASGGAAALKAEGYGTMSASAGSDNAGRKRGTSDEMSASEASKIAERKADSSRPSSPLSKRQDAAPGGGGEEPLNVPDKIVVGANGETTGVGEEGDEVGEMQESSGRDRSQRRQARSGSITQTTVDIGGMKKMVLETSDSAEEDEGEDGREDGAGEEGPKRRKSGRWGSGS
ncbi:cell agglutination protein Mam3 [Vermiconidia calcicola]|uniref:Cell agglutination protein Mam3 n=1 Tax=Vermiconidia calcicola TaxID=1690605 RepID=A0ACC3NEG1_9PEZI|nr:cell agglutination protein Mam3 [Vermiconidia calcicola]